MRMFQHIFAITIIGILNFGALGISGTSSSDVPSREIAVPDLPQILDSEDETEKLYQEFASIEGGQRRPWTIAILPENIKKNRYQDELLAFDHSRVVLDKLPDDPYSDYINANYIDGENSEKEYVATQGPLPHTINDFWRMIWQLNVTKIVMMANVIEHGEVKVEKYWPDSSAIYGDIEVINMREYHMSSLQHIVRTFSVKKDGIVQPRIVRHFHFTGWPDLGVPEDRLPVVSIIRQARLFDPESKAPIVVHCSAGIGRTGTTILLDSMIERGEKERVVDFPKRLDHMRTLRPDLVEKKEQYVFAYQAVNEFFNSPQMQQDLQDVKALYLRMDKEMVSTREKRQVLLRMKRHKSIRSMPIEEMQNSE